MFAAIRSMSFLVQSALAASVILSLIGGAAYLKHQYDTGIVDAERAMQAQISDKRTREVIETSHEVDNDVARKGSPAAALRKGWQRAD